jgi:SH3-like domain-containing protein
VQVVDETSEWRKVCDPDGGAVWVASAMVDGRRTVMAAGAAPLALRKAPDEAAGPSAYLRPRAIAVLGRCAGGWCDVDADGAAGWVRANQVWGLATQPLCR